MPARSLSERHLDHRLQVHTDPRFFPKFSNADFYYSKRCLDRGGAVLSGDGGGAASDEAASVNRDSLAAARAAVAAADNDGQNAFEEHVIFQGGPITHDVPPIVGAIN